MATDQESTLGQWAPTVQLGEEFDHPAGGATLETADLDRRLGLKPYTFRICLRNQHIHLDPI